MHFYRNCHALITGASSGLGAEFARQLAPHARTLILVARREDQLLALKAELERPGLEIRTRHVDLSRHGEVDQLLEWIEEEQLPVSLLINNAGLGDHGRFDTGEWERVRQMLDVNIHSLTRLSFGLLPRLRTQPSAAILNVSSVAGMLPMPKMAVYAATKAYVSSFSEALRAELAVHGIHVTHLCPGPVSTGFGDTAERKTTGERVPAPEMMKVPAAKVVADGLKAVARNRPRKIPGLFVSFVMLLTAAMPLCVLRLAMKNQAK